MSKEAIPEASTRAAHVDRGMAAAIARLRAYEVELQRELATLEGSVMSALFAYAHAGEPTDIPGRSMRAQAISTVLAAMPAAIGYLAEECRDAMHERNAVVNAAAREGARAMYKERLAQFDANYNALSQSHDLNALHRAAGELAKLASKALMIEDLRECLRSKFGSRHRASELLRY